MRQKGYSEASRQELVTYSKRQSGSSEVPSNNSHLVQNSLAGLLGVTEQALSSGSVVSSSLSNSHFSSSSIRELCSGY